MSAIRFKKEISIKASNQKVWEVLLNDDTYRKWTAAFTEGSYFEGTWEEGSTMKFLAPDNNGLASKVIKHDKGKEIVLSHQQMIYNGAASSPEPGEDEWVGYEEIYRTEERGGEVILTIEQDLGSKEEEEQFSVLWDKALMVIKELAQA